MDEDQVISRALEIARTRFPDESHLHAPFVACVLYLTSGGQRWRIPDLGHDRPTAWEQAVFQWFPAEQLPEGGVPFKRAVRMIARSRAFGRLSTRHFRCWWTEMSGDNPSAVRTFSRD